MLVLKMYIKKENKNDNCINLSMENHTDESLPKGMPKQIKDKKMENKNVKNKNKMISIKNMTTIIAKSKGKNAHLSITLILMKGGKE